jgi:hypothetical protein
MREEVPDAALERGSRAMGSGLEMKRERGLQSTTTTSLDGAMHGFGRTRAPARGIMAAPTPPPFAKGGLRSGCSGGRRCSVQGKKKGKKKRKRKE